MPITAFAANLSFCFVFSGPKPNHSHWVVNVHKYLFYVYVLNISIAVDIGQEVVIVCLTIAHEFTYLFL